MYFGWDKKSDSKFLLFQVFSIRSLSSKNRNVPGKGRILILYQLRVYVAVGLGFITVVIKNLAVYISIIQVEIARKQIAGEQFEF